MADERPSLSRRDALRSIGTGGSLYALGVSGLSTSASAGGALQQSGRSDGWTDRVTNEIDSGCFNNTIHTSHSLSYLDASWEPYGSPSVEGGNDVRGCWRHTFALTGVGAGDRFDDELLGLPYGAMSMNVPTIGDDEDHPAESQADEPPEPTATAVSARRHPLLFNFAERTAFEQYMNQADVSPSDISDTSVSEDEIHDRLFQTQADLSEQSAVDGSVAISAASAVLGSVVSDGSDELDRFARYASRASILLGLIDVIGEYADALSVEQHPRVDRGFAARFPLSIYTDSDHYVEEKVWPGTGEDPNWQTDNCNPGGVYFGAGCHYLVFDVYEAPGSDHVSAVDLVSAFDRTTGGVYGDATTVGWSIVLDTPVPDDGDPSTVPVSERFSAEVEVSDAVTRRDPTRQVTN